MTRRDCQSSSAVCSLSTMNIDQILSPDLFESESSSDNGGLLTPPPYTLFSHQPPGFDFLPQNPADDAIAGLRCFNTIHDELAIDPQLVDSPASSDPAPAAVTIKVGGHGKARRGTVLTGAVSKKGGPAFHISALQQHPALPLTSSPAASPSPNSPSNAKPPPKPPTILKPTASKKPKHNKDLLVEEDEDDVPRDWRPSPEVFAKMSSKEKRQLRNKISARNFRVRRKGPSVPFLLFNIG